MELRLKENPQSEENPNDSVAESKQNLKISQDSNEGDESLNLHNESLSYIERSEQLVIKSININKEKQFSDDKEIIDLNSKSEHIDSEQRHITLKKIEDSSNPKEEAKESLLKNEKNSINSENLDEEEAELPENTSSIRIIEIFHSVYDTSQSFKIHKYLVQESGLSSIKEYLSLTVQLIGVYGISGVMKKFISIALDDELNLFPKNEGLYLFYNKNKSLGVLAFITPYEDLYIDSPIKSSNRFIAVIRILSDLCKKIIACISEDIIKKWYYEESGGSNPFKPKIHQSYGALLKEVTVQESRIEDIKLECYSSIWNKKLYILPKDNIPLLFYYEFQSISQIERKLTSEALRKFPGELFKLIDISAYSMKINELFNKMKIQSLDHHSIKTDLRRHFEKMLKEKKDALAEVIRKISLVVQEKFNYKNLMNNQINYRNTGMKSRDSYINDMLQTKYDRDYLDKTNTISEKQTETSEPHGDHFYDSGYSSSSYSSSRNVNFWGNSNFGLRNLNRESSLIHNSLSIEYQIENAITSSLNLSIENLSKDIILKIEKDLKYKENSYLGQIIEKYYNQYSQNKKKLDYDGIVNRMSEEINKYFEFSEFKTKFLVFGKTFEELKQDLAKSLKNNNHMKCDEFKSCCEKKLMCFIDKPENQILKRLLVEPLREYLEILKIIENTFKKDCDSTLSPLEASFSGKQFRLYKSYIKIDDKGKRNTSDLFCTIDHSINLFNEFIKSENTSVNQIIGLDASVFFVLISNNEKSVTHVLRFNPNLKTKDDLEICKDIEDPDVILAWGSTPNKYIIFHNRSKIASHGCLKLNKYMQEGIPLDIYSKINKVVNGYYMKKSRKLYMIDDNGLLYCRELVSDQSETYIVNSTSRACDLDKFEPLKPSKGDKFLEIDISEDENIIFLQTEIDIECFDKNFIQTHSIPLSDQFLSYKNVSFSNQCFLVIQNKNFTMNCIKVVSPKQETLIENTQKITKVVDGNPIFDIHHMGIIKFGPIVEQTQIIKGNRSLGYFSFSKKNIRILNYLKGLKEVQNSFENIGFVIPDDVFDDIEDIEFSQLLYAICTRFPIHIASIQNGNLIPLQNGVNNFEDFTRSIGKESFVDSLTDYIKFGHYEEILENIKNMLVVSIIGRQSSGKSYLLNRIAGTRFDVAAERCTEGIWMGIGHIDETQLVVFDCEGLFTVERSTQEEIKLCLFISSLSDLIILNSDLSSGKHIKGLFDEFSSGVDRLKGKHLFKGTLDITYRDIPDSQESGAKLEFNKFLLSLLETGKKETLTKLFNENIKNSLYHNFEINLFNDEVENKRYEYIEEIPKKWASNVNFGLMMKMILMQIFSDDVMSVDIRLFSAQTRKFRTIVDNIIYSTDQAKKYLKEDLYSGSIQIDPEFISFTWIIRDFYKDNEDPFIFFKFGLFTQTYESLFRKSHNILFKQLDEQIKLFFEKRKMIIVNFFKDQLPKAEEYKDQIVYDILGIENKLDKFSNYFKYCLRNCEQCDFYCTKVYNHIEKCDCGTDHICKEFCSICGNSSICSLLNGHRNSHVCRKIAHKCIEKCNLKNCEKTCTFDPGHEGDCRCSSSHPCGQPCEMNIRCGQLCRYDITEEHIRHNCEEKCPFKCIFEDGNGCSSLNHFHDFELEEEDIENGGKIKRHICSTAHTCLSLCISPGICNVNTTLVKKVYRNKYNEFIYPYVDLIPERLLCKEVVLSGEISHEKLTHLCGSNKHLCEARCPDCNCFCMKKFGHDGLHSSKNHRNKECSEYISIEESFSGIIQDESKLKTVTYVAGESASPEICDQYCITKGRGHTHPMPCKGGELCLEITDRGFAIHSNNIYKSGENNGTLYDFVTCDTYWMKCGWVPPNKKNNPEMQNLFSKCNFACDHISHENDTQKVYCEGNLFHSFSLNYTDHDFKCIHPASSFYNIVFIVDCTGSMSSYFSGVQNVIKDLVAKWGGDINRFAFIGYTDHPPDHGLMPSNNPVCIFPTSLDMNDGDETSIVTFIKGISVSGGGGNGGEAMIDGLASANKLHYQNNASIIYIVISDDSPHGREFNSKSEYPNGCPCGYKWRDVLQIMKARNAEFILVKLNDILNKTADLFKNFYGDKLSVMPLRSVSEFQMKVFNKVSQKIETDYVFSKKLRK